MVKKILIWLKSYDWFLTINMLLLMFFSLAILYSLQINVNEPNFTYFNRQLVFAVIGLILFFALSMVNYHFWADYYKIILIAIAGVLILVLVAGVKIRGTTGWFAFFGQTFQPVELAKIALIIFLAKYYSLKASQYTILKNVLVSGFFAGLIIVLVIMQPDLGSAILLLATWLGLVFLLPVQKKTILIIFLIFAAVAAGAWFFMLQDYQKDRLLNFFNPENDPLGSGYNVRQAVVAVGSGQFFGRGLGLGSQSQLNFLPEQQTDFIFAVISEELGFVGSGLVLLLFLSLIWRIYTIAKNSGDTFAYLFCFGLMILMVVQILINVGMNLGVAPVTGIPLPFVSYGGSSLLSMMLALAIVHNIQIHNKKTLFRSSF